MPYVAPPGFRTVRVVTVTDPDLYRDPSDDTKPPVGSTVAVSISAAPDAERTAKRGKPFYAWRVAWLAADGSEAKAFIQGYTSTPPPAPAPVASKRRWPWIVAGLAVLAWLAS